MLNNCSKLLKHIFVAKCAFKIGENVVYIHQPIYNTPNRYYRLSIVINHTTPTSSTSSPWVMLCCKADSTMQITTHSINLPEPASIAASQNSHIYIMFIDVEHCQWPAVVFACKSTRHSQQQKIASLKVACGIQSTCSLRTLAATNCRRRTSESYVILRFVRAGWFVCASLLFF